MSAAVLAGIMYKVTGWLKYRPSWIGLPAGLVLSVLFSAGITVW